MRKQWHGFELPTRVEVDLLSEDNDENHARFTAEPFERGYGITVGNALRRVLLSSIEGIAVTSVKIEGVAHEFSSIEGVVEDVTDIILNVKKILFRFTEESNKHVSLRDDKKAASIQLELKADQKGVLRAKDLVVGDRIEVVNLEHKICELSENVPFSMKLTVERGRGYRTADENRPREKVVGEIAIDSIFSPVLRAKWRTENTRVGQVTNYDKMILDVWTDGTVKPERALVEASTILRKHLDPFVKYFDIGTEAAPSAEALPAVEDKAADEASEAALQRNLDLPITVLDPSVRVTNCLEADGVHIKTIGELIQKTEAQMMRDIPNFGATSLAEMVKKLAAMGLNFATEEAQSE